MNIKKKKRKSKGIPLIQNVFDICVPIMIDENKSLLFVTQTNESTTHL
jgi:hypothetical protein